MSVSPTACTAATFVTPSVLGIDVLSLSAVLVQNYTKEVSDIFFYNHPSTSLKGIDYCNVTVTYTHPGENDTVNVETWLPANNWNERLMAVGGGGLVAGRFFLSYEAMAGGISEGYVTTTTDAGNSQTYGSDSSTQVSPGNVDMYALQNLASVSLNDQAIISKSLVKDFYGQAPAYSYWSGCSQGGRQGMMLAQRYPDAYDGIAASAPAINWGQLIPSAAWGQVYMDLMNTFPFPCELDAITAAAVDFCDGLDGVVDGLISDPDSCHFDPATMVGTEINCTETGETMAITAAAAAVVNMTWTGPRSNNSFLWYGPYQQARLTGISVPTSVSDLGLAMTSCTNSTCVGYPLGLGENWMKWMINKDPEWNYTLITSVSEYANLFHKSVQQYDSIIGTADPDLREFQQLGGKLISYHGLADGIIPTQGTTDYYNRVLEVTPNAQDYYRYFQVPGLGHCSGGEGGQPTATFQALVDWVENGVAPDTLPINFTDTNGILNERILCPYPQKPIFSTACANTTAAECFSCA